MPYMILSSANFILQMRMGTQVNFSKSSWLDSYSFAEFCSAVSAKVFVSFSSTKSCFQEGSQVPACILTCLHIVVCVWITLTPNDNGICHQYQAILRCIAWCLTLPGFCHQTLAEVGCCICSACHARPPSVTTCGSLHQDVHFTAVQHVVHRRICLAQPVFTALLLSVKWPPGLKLSWN